MKVFLQEIFSCVLDSHRTLRQMDGGENSDARRGCSVKSKIREGAALPIDMGGRGKTGRSHAPQKSDA
jgi:hypothetical protein